MPTMSYLPHASRYLMKWEIQHRYLELVAQTESCSKVTFSANRSFSLKHLPDVSRKNLHVVEIDTVSVSAMSQQHVAVQQFSCNGCVDFSGKTGSDDTLYSTILHCHTSPVIRSVTDILH